MLFEHTMRKPQSFTAPADRFFVIRQEVLYCSSGLFSIISVNHGLRVVFSTLFNTDYSRQIDVVKSMFKKQYVVEVQSCTHFLLGNMGTSLVYRKMKNISCCHCTYYAYVVAKLLGKQNGSFRGFGFADKSAAIEMKDRVIKAVQPYSIGTTPSPIEEEFPAESLVKDSVISYRSVPRRSISRRLNNTGSEIYTGRNC